MSKQREAISTIRGYVYQFNVSILTLLNLDSTESVITVEGIEDIDIEHINGLIESIQCKYYEGTEYNHYVIGKAIRWMLQHFTKNKESDFKYKIYGHYKSGQEKFTTEHLNPQFFKKTFFSYTDKGIHYKIHETLKLTTEDIVRFIDKLDINIYAESFDSLKESIIEKIAENQCCDTEEAEHYYNNAFNVIVTLATNKEITKRKINKSDFLNKLNNKDTLFNKWFLLFKGEEQYCKEIKRKHFTSGLNISFAERFFLIDCSKETDLAKIKDLIYLTAKKWSKLLKNEPKKFCPYFYLHNISLDSLIKLKQEIHTESIIFKDGYDFYGATFDVQSIVQKPTIHNNIKFRLINDLKYIDNILSAISSTIEIFQFYIKTPFYTPKKKYIKHIEIQVPNINLIKNII